MRSVRNLPQQRFERLRGKTLHAPVSDQNQGNAVSVEGTEIFEICRRSLDIVFDIAELMTLEILACFFAVRAPAGAVHDDRAFIVLAMSLHFRRPGKKIPGGRQSSQQQA